MKKASKIIVVAIVFLVTVYQILPTLFYYRHQLSKPASLQEAKEAVSDILQRISSIEKDSVAVIKKFANNIGLEPKSVEISSVDNKIVVVSFDDENDGEKFFDYIDDVGGDGVFFHQKLSPMYLQGDKRKVLVYRAVARSFADEEALKFNFIKKYGDDGGISKEYKAMTFDRLRLLSLILAGNNKQKVVLRNLINDGDEEDYDDIFLSVGEHLIEVVNSFGVNHKAVKRYASSLFFSEGSEKFFSSWRNVVEAKISKRRRYIEDIGNNKNKIRGVESLFSDKFDGAIEKKLADIERWKKIGNVVEEISSGLSMQGEILTAETFKAIVANGEQSTGGDFYILELPANNIFVKGFVVDWIRGEVQIVLHDDILEELEVSKNASEDVVVRKQKIENLVIQYISEIGRFVGENIFNDGKNFFFKISRLTDSSAFLKVDIKGLIDGEKMRLKKSLEAYWNPRHDDFQRDVFKIYDYKEYVASDKNLGLGVVIYSPMVDDLEDDVNGFRKCGVYAFTQGLSSIMRNYEGREDSEGAKILKGDIDDLCTFMRGEGFGLMPPKGLLLEKWMSDELAFENVDICQQILDATQENFVVLGDYSSSFVEFTNVEQRLLTKNAIESKAHEKLIQWRDHCNRVAIDSKNKIPRCLPATRSVFWDNIALSFRKYFRGDDRKILKWGLDLSGGKTVTIALNDDSGNRVSDEESLQRARNELNARINKMGVSEVNIRVEVDTLVLDFPSSQGFSAKDLIEGSTMSFHIVNEKFSIRNKELNKDVNEFLRKVWNQAVVTNKNDVKGVNDIAASFLGYSRDNGKFTSVVDGVAKVLQEAGLQIFPIEYANDSNVFDDSFCKIFIYRNVDERVADVGHPLEIVFRNCSLRGSELMDIQPSYDLTRGYSLHFDVADKFKDKNARGNPQEYFKEWTSAFAKSKVVGTNNEKYSMGRGWRMAIVLNDEIISAPELESPLSNSGSITGKFTQKEINSLCMDLKAGTMSFSPQILSEYNVNPELGKRERFLGISATIVGLCAVMITMCLYYKTAGIFASIAVVFNLLIMWGMLQSINAVLTLSGIAGIILTIGMAVDSNVLIFERIREEFKKTKRLSAAISIGYKKAFAAIVDSNLTTIVAAIILMQFDAGPVKGFAISLIMGIASSLFTALFVTHLFFDIWMQKSKPKDINMAQFSLDKKLNFTKIGKPVSIVALIAIVCGGLLFVVNKGSIIGMDFAGGYVVDVDFDNDSKESTKSLVENALNKHGVSSQDFGITTLGRESLLRIYLSEHLDESVFADVLGGENGKNLRLKWLVNTFSKEGVKIRDNDMETLENSWGHTSGQMSHGTRNNAISAVLISLMFTFLYITLRFEIKYAIGAMIALIHDVLITLAAVSVFHFIGLDVQINSHVIAAILTIIGYSLNDTIVVFDRIREESAMYNKFDFEKLVNKSLGITLNRTLITSFTTLIALMPLLVFGGGSLFSFSLTMAVGIVFGTISSIFIAPLIMLFFHKRNLRTQY